MTQHTRLLDIAVSNAPSISASIVVSLRRESEEASHV